MTETSIFTKIINGEIPSKIIYEDDLFIVIHDIKPIAPIHVLIITKQQYESLEHVDVENTAIHAGLLITARKVAKELGIADNYKLMMNVGRKVQFVHHIHLHLLGGWDKDKSTEELDDETVAVLDEK